jgi:hypothetical protein
MVLVSPFSFLNNRSVFLYTTTSVEKIVLFYTTTAAVYSWVFVCVCVCVVEVVYDDDDLSRTVTLQGVILFFGIT